MTFENLKLDYLYQTFSTFRESEVSNLISLIKQSRIGRCIKFKCYGCALFNEEDTKHENAIIKELEKFERKNSNVVVFEVIDEDCKNVFTELFLYQNVALSQSSYGLIGYNSNTGETSHKIQINYDLYDLVIALNKEVLYMQHPNPFK